MNPTHTCTTTLAPGVAWPPMHAPPKYERVRPEPKNPRIPEAERLAIARAIEASVLRALTIHGPKTTGRLAKLVDISKGACEGALRRLSHHSNRRVCVHHTQPANRQGVICYYGLIETKTKGKP